MIIRTTALLLLIPALSLAGTPPSSGQGETDDASYSLGYKLGDRVRIEVTDIEVSQFLLGFEHGYTGKHASRLTEEEMKAAIDAYQKQRVESLRDEREGVRKSNSEQGKALLAKNARRPGVVTTPSGLQYEVLSKGAGASPKPNDIVLARYHGTLPDGTVFDSTRERGDEPAEFPLNKVIPGWTEGLQLMKRGAKYRFYVPAELAYGERGAGRVIGPNQMLIFEIELVDFQPEVSR